MRTSQAPDIAIADIKDATPLSARARVRFALAVTVVVMLYALLDAALMALGGRLLGAGVDIAALGAPAPEPVARDDAKEAILEPRHRSAAWRLGFYYGIASQMAAVDPRGRARAEVLLREAEDSARLLGIDAFEPLHSSTATQTGFLPQRIDADEGGLAQRVQEATTRRHRHLFLAGAFAGTNVYSRTVAPQLESPIGLAELERHARLAGLPVSLWRPMTRPSGASPEARRDAAFMAAQQVEAALGTSAASSGQHAQPEGRTP